MKEIVEDIYKKIDEINSNSLHIPEKYITEFSESMGHPTSNSSIMIYKPSNSIIIFYIR